MPTQLTHPAPAAPALSISAGPTLEERRVAIDMEIHGISLIGDYWRRTGERTDEYDAMAVLKIYEHASNIYWHVEACPVTAARFDAETREMLSKLAARHRALLANQPPPRKSTTRDPRKRPPPEPVVEPHKDVSNDGGVARSHARRAPLATQPYQRSARPTIRKQKVEDVEDVPEAIAASVRAAQADVPQERGPAVPSSLDDLCALFSATSLNAAAPAASTTMENVPSDPAPAPAPQLSTPVSSRTLITPPAPITSRVRGKSAPVRANPLDRSGRRRSKTAQL